jgi:hypothetical protein
MLETFRTDPDYITIIVVLEMSMHFHECSLKQKSQSQILLHFNVPEWSWLFRNIHSHNKYCSSLIPLIFLKKQHFLHFHMRNKIALHMRWFLTFFFRKKMLPRFRLLEGSCSYATLCTKKVCNQSEVQCSADNNHDLKITSTQQMILSFHGHSLLMLIFLGVLYYVMVRHAAYVTEISGSNGHDYQHYCPLGCDFMYSEVYPNKTFNLYHPMRPYVHLHNVLVNGVACVHLAAI